MAKDIKIVQVCFNVLDPYQRELYEKVESQYNKSAYIKRLIEREYSPVVTKSHDDFDVNQFI